MMHWYDVSNANAPYDNEFFDVAWDGYEGGQRLERQGGVFGLGGVLGGDNESAEDVTDLPVTEVESLPCDFTSGPAIVSLQQALITAGALAAPPERVSPVTGVFDDATCAAWVKHYGEKPTPESLTRVLLPAGAQCPTVVMPACTQVRAAGWGMGKTLLVGAVIAGALVAAKKVWKR
jgi:hypothetical protein